MSRQWTSPFLLVLSSKQQFWPGGKYKFVGFGIAVMSCDSAASLPVGVVDCLRAMEKPGQLLTGPEFF
jgi:hypothetical protein